MAKKQQEATVEETTNLEEQAAPGLPPSPSTQQLPPLVVDLGQLQAQLLMAKSAVDQAREEFVKAEHHYQAAIKHQANCQEHFDAGVAAMRVLTGCD